MRKINILIITIFSTLMVACGGSEDNSSLAQKKAKLDSLKTQFSTLRTDIKTLEDEIARIDPEARANEILVATTVPGKKDFVHTLQLRANVESKKNVMLSAETMGVVRNVYVTEGQKVSKGDLLVSMDADILTNSIKEVETQLELAEEVFNRQSKLWKQKIGTEMQYLQAKSNYESLQRKKSTLQAQLNQARVRAPFSGTIDLVNAKTGEMVQPGTPLVRLVNPSEMYIKADVSEAYLGRFQVGDPLTVEIPGEDKSYKTTVKSVSNVLNTNNRTFQLEAKLPKTESFVFRPNQVTVLTIADYKSEDAVVIPSNVILSGNDGKFVYVVKNGNAQNIASKVSITTGKSQNNQTEVLSGLTGNEAVITKGYREVSNGAAVKVDGKGTSSVASK
ncbi:RND family efflux transporter, MFP subunit [Ekhidna lutea]|uniref:RND family efflux transporter, MFP subunit n=1 Tax=Ekhidna lutea TaxID=447679 RepID=A0A239LK10_EKHLU|nr:efflux RND transporter periplasmic adaptor subunit [Ekhidna lutea]SNT30228.1 RND family efflux transporter, MFP subunit [Ekhidna lutea]